MKGIAQDLNELMIKSCNEMPCSGASPILKIAASFPVFQYLWVVHQDPHKGFKYN